MDPPQRAAITKLPFLNAVRWTRVHVLSVRFFKYPLDIAKKRGIIKKDNRVNKRQTTIAAVNVNKVFRPISGETISPKVVFRFDFRI